MKSQKTNLINYINEFYLNGKWLNYPKKAKNNQLLKKLKIVKKTKE